MKNEFYNLNETIEHKESFYFMLIPRGAGRTYFEEKYLKNKTERDKNETLGGAK